MASEPFHRSPPDQWSNPRPYSDPASRYRKYGPVRPMEEPGIFSRLSEWMGTMIGRE